MKVRISNIIPFLFMLSLYVASFSSFFKAEDVRNAEYIEFSCDRCNQWNNWHYVGILFLIVAVGFTIGLFRWDSQNNDDESQDDTP